MHTHTFGLAAILTASLLFGSTHILKAQNDFDSDGVLNSVDIDNDNDGITDLAESFGQNSFGDADNDGILNWLDADFSFTYNGRTFSNSALDMDGDNIPNVLDRDADNDGIYDGAEANNEKGTAIAAFDYTTAQVIGAPVASTSYTSSSSVMTAQTQNVSSPGNIASNDGGAYIEMAMGTNNGVIVIDLGSVIPGNQGYKVRIVGIQKSGAWKTTDVDVQGSISVGSGYTTFGNVATTANALETHTFTITADTRYLRLYTDPTTVSNQNKEMRVDYIEFTYPITITSNGMPANSQTTPGNGISIYTLPDTDGDGIANFLDKDADNDGILDIIEGQSFINTVVLSGMDADGDGIDNAFDAQCAPCALVMGKVISQPINTDGTSNADFASIDTDSDGANDWIEAVDALNNGATDDIIIAANAFNLLQVTDVYSTTDANGNKIPDFMDDDNNNGTPNFLDPSSTGYYFDTDNDGIIDLYDASTQGTTVNPVTTLGASLPSYRNTTVIAPLPVELVSFTAEQVMGSVILDWSTASELNNKGFEVLRSIDGQKWEVIGFVAGMGTTQDQQQYSFADRHASSLGSKVVYYQLNQTDFNGENEKSEVRSVRMGNEVATEKPQVRFNMNEGRLHITSTTQADYYMLTSANGQQIRISPATTSYDMSGMIKGIYYFSVVYNNGTVETQPVVIK